MFKTERTSKEVLEPLLAERMDSAQIAEVLGVDRATVTRAIRRHGLEAPHIKSQPRMRAEEVQRIEVLSREGMPATWIAEDIGRAVEGVRDRTAEIGDADARLREWWSVWQDILKHPHLYELHREFAPR